MLTGSGAFGDVYEGKWNFAPVAVKKLTLQKVSCVSLPLLSAREAYFPASVA